MASVAVQAAVDARVTTYWTATPVTARNDRAADTPLDASAFLSVQFPLSDAGQVSVGSPGAQLFRESGAIRFVLTIPRGDGDTYWRTQLEALLAHFRATKFAGVQTFAPTNPTDDDRGGEGNFYLLTAVVPYTADTLG